MENALGISVLMGNARGLSIQKQETSSMIILDPCVSDELHRRADDIRHELRQQIDAVVESNDQIDIRRSMAMQMV
jgi:hypothetical protein